jgi:hypothetical protein
MLSDNFVVNNIVLGGGGLYVKVKYSLYLIKYCALRTYVEEKLRFQAFLNSAPDGGKWSASRPCRFNPGETAHQYILHMECTIRLESGFHCFIFNLSS